MDRKMTTQASLGIVVLFISFMITGCSGGGGGVGFVAPPAATYSVGGVVSGLTGTGLVLTNNGGDNLALSSNGTFTFPTGLSSNATYSVASVAQPGGKQCVVTSGTGTVGSANVTDVAVVCTVTDVTSGLAAEYQCDGNVNDSVGSANGTPSGGFAYTTDRYGNSSSACSFNGTDAKVHVAGAISAPGSTGFSLSLWTKTTNTTFTGSIVYGNFLFSIHGSMILTVIPGATMSTSMTYSQNTWAHVVGTYDDTTGLIKLYKDGALVSQATKSGAVGAASLTSLDLGQNAWPAATYWNGALDDIRYYGRTLSDSEVQQLYDYQKPASRKTFVTATVFDGNLVAAEGTHKATGIGAADALCLKDGNYPGAGVYKAFLVDAANRVASVSANAGDGQIGWVLRP
ncbi:MAG TPA: LamG domain-containing protein, partial [Nitrospirota bacterium]|nr:LamG domain-containing protein [Nitrospirota bacterium]